MQTVRAQLPVTTNDSYKEIVIRGPLHLNKCRHLIEAANIAKPNETLRLFIKSCGGNLMEGLKAIEAIRHTAGNFEVEVVDYAESMAAVIMAHARKIYMQPNAIIMFHLPRSLDDEQTTVNDSNMVHKKVANRMYTILKEQASDLISKEEFGRIAKGHSIYLSGDTLIHRSSRVHQAPNISRTDYDIWKFVRCNIYKDFEDDALTTSRSMKRSIK